ncbi:hypothetical protein B5X24_HaOG208003 [Helicoverpa armigera]|uniref:Uncharacterized protein n=1 Tax=Helicoverpa armigera TaxID=29058 RepID=A0A2W1BJ34_HELAM|nr:hypothetical protein B5X24_HaOG208003 [Helicoverpa armigera]
MTLADFRAELAEALCNYKKALKREEDPLVAILKENLKRRNLVVTLNPVPVKYVRTDDVDHNERRCEKKNRCKLPGCKDSRAPSAPNALLLFAIPKKEIVLLHFTVRLGSSSTHNVSKRQHIYFS